MTPQSVGVPDSTLVLGKHSGRHALAIRCEQLGYQFDRRELDAVYRDFVKLADRIKHVQDHHLLELLSAAKAPAHTVAPVQSQAGSAAATAGMGERSREPISKQSKTNFHVPIIPFLAKEHGEQEDYLWGV
jgi:isopropylmalate/homocitrate/citramalate synthase